MPVTTGKIADYIKFTRDSLATVTDRDGLIKWAAHNLLTNSENFAVSPWVARNSVISNNVAVAPNGTTTADSINADGTGSFHYVEPVVSFTYFSVSYTLAVFMKKDTNRYGWVSSYDGTNTYGGVFDLQNGVYVGNRTGSGPSTNSITPVGNDWFLCTITYTPVAVTTSYPAAFGTNNDGNLGIIDASTGKIFLWGAHLYRSDLGGMQSNSSAYPMYNSTSPKNLFSFTEDFSQPVWWKSGITPTPNAAVSPNGMMNSYKLVESNTTSAHHVYWNGGLQTGSRTFSIYAKAAGRNYLYIADGYNGLLGAIVVDLITGNVVQNTAQRTVNVVPAPQGFYRISVIFSSTSNFLFMFGPNNTASMLDSYNNTYTGDGVSGIYVWGVQSSDSASLDPYVPNHFAAPTSAAYHGPRLDYDPVTRASKGMLVEEQRTNLQLNSNVFGTSTFLATVVANAAASPSGLIDASSVACTAVGGRAILSTSVTSGIVYTFSVFIKAGTNTSAYIELASTAGSGGAVVFNLSSGTITSGTGGAIVPAPNGFYRCSVTSTATGTGASDMRIGTGDATSKTIFVYGAQLEANASFATSYIPTGAAPATRNADDAQVSTQAFPYSSTEGTLVATYQLLSNTGSLKRVFDLHDTTKGNYVNIIALNGINTTGAAIYAEVVDGSSPQASFNLGTPAAGINKGALAWAVNNFGAAHNGTAQTPDTTGTVPSANNLRIGAHVDGTFLNGWIRQITYLQRRIPETELQTRTS